MRLLTDYDIKLAPSARVPVKKKEIIKVRDDMLTSANKVRDKDSNGKV